MNHIELTIADLTAARNRADLMIQSLRDFQSGAFGAATPGPAETTAGDVLIEESRRVTGPPPDSLGQNVSRGTAIKGKPGRAKTNKGAKGGETEVTGEQMHAAAAKLKEPFKAADLRLATGVSQKKADNYLRQRVDRQIFTALGDAQYKRGPKFDATGRAGTPVPAAGAHGVTRPTRNGKVQPPTPVPPGTVATGSLPDKPDTVVGAMKFLLRDEPEPFTQAELEATLNGDKDWKKLLETEVGQRSLVQALNNWKFQGYLERVDDTFTVTAKGKEWMSR